MKAGELRPKVAQQTVAQLAQQFAESAKLEGEIKKNLAGLGYSLNTEVNHD